MKYRENLSPELRETLAGMSEDIVVLDHESFHYGRAQMYEWIGP